MDVIKKDYLENKKEWEALLKQSHNEKIKECTTKEGRFDYFKMHEMIEQGRW